MKTEKEIQKKFEEVLLEDNFADGLDDSLIKHSEIRILKWVLGDRETEELQD